MACRDDETLGPVVSVCRVGSDDEAMRHANNSDLGLNASVWTRDVARGRRIARSIKAGTVNINDGYVEAWGSVGAPMGAMNNSGLSRRHGIEGITRCTEPQSVSAQHLVGFAAPFGLFDKLWAKTLTVALGAMKRLECGNGRARHLRIGRHQRAEDRPGLGCLLRCQHGV